MINNAIRLVSEQARTRVLVDDIQFSKVQKCSMTMRIGKTYGILMCEGVMHRVAMSQTGSSNFISALNMKEIVGQS